MFDILKKKLNSFSSKLKETVSKKEPETPQEPEEKTVSKPIEKGKETIPEPAEAKKPAGGEKLIEEKLPEEPAKEGKIEAPEAAKAQETREIKAKISAKGKLKGLLTGSVTIEEKDLKSFLEELELALLEADVEQNTAEKISKEIKSELVGKKIAKKQLDEFLKKEIKEVLQKVMQAEKINVLEKIAEKKEKPFVILFLGPNGAGKTTSIGKLTNFFQKKGKTVLWAASDTFRAASIEQLEKHAEKLKVRVVKHQYGADPAAVAFDAIAAAKAKGTDVVMIDSAGRQETNKNLMEELKKIVRVAKPDLKIFVGEALSGQALVQQATEFDKNLGLDGFILTKIDTDAKGGTTISLIYNLKKPVLFVGTGQEYKDLMEFKPEFIIERVVG